MLYVSAPQMVDCVHPVLIDIDGVKLVVRCGKCPICELRKKSDWTVRLQMEAAYHEFSSFCTLTYQDLFRPRNGIQYSDVQLFLKRLRKRVGSFRFFCANEYGSSANTFREHAHIIFFGLRCSEDLKRQVSEAWPYGFTLIRGMTSDDACCNYTCGYVDKKSESFLDDKEAKYRDFQYNVLGKRKPFVVMSRRPGIGYAFYQANKDKMREQYCFYWHGVRHALNPYFVKLLKQDYPDFAEDYICHVLSDQDDRFARWMDTHFDLVDQYCDDTYRQFGLDVDSECVQCAISHVHHHLVNQHVINLRRQQEIFRNRYKEVI